MKKELTKEERYALAGKLDAILGADLMPEEIETIEQAIAFISPEFAADTEAEIQEAAEWFDNATEEEIKKMADDAMKSLPPRKDGTIIRFGEMNK